MLNNNLFYGPFLSLACNAFIPIVISIHLNEAHEVDTLWGEASANIYTNVLEIYVFVWFPCAMLYVIFNEK